MAKKITVEQISNTANAYRFFSCRPSCDAGFEYVREGHIFDENKSVKWNKDEVQRKNAEYEAEVKRLNTEKGKLYTQFNDEVFQYIKQELKCSDAYAKRVQNALVDVAKALTPDDEYWMHMLCEDTCMYLIDLIKDKE